MTYFLVRLLQRFDRFELAPDCQPEGSCPPAEWRGEGKKGRQRCEDIWPAAALTLFVKVGWDSGLGSGADDFALQGGLWVKLYKAERHTH